MKAYRNILIAATLALSTTGAQASWTECVVNKDVDAVNRPHGNGVGRWATLTKGTKIAFRDSYQDWTFVSHWVGEDGDAHEEFGWVPRNTLDHCKPQEGTP